GGTPPPPMGPMSTTRQSDLPINSPTFGLGDLMESAKAGDWKYHPPPKGREDGQLKGFPDAIRMPTPAGGRPWWKIKGGWLEWDFMHGTVEQYDKRGKHQGEYDPETGEQTDPPDKGRRPTNQGKK
ncbi:MAG: colicin E3/pyocin S6 family cytotoxin, partial [Bacteroidota bacterium]